ncbi:hypothetical protein AHMF7605_10565 [Adhaeribacter arboris]|uniref:Uncharacterized protein n=1 Tax=Adhaeribacter arboris TaxID=2072846 RepID=A0A2T2YEJ2_9BACT|nr:hypothetical protein [Adhaeribacter arboris]PSR53929.1 hypothetical protein AHMF7605_10565 [Adhaeribacter arboris]
MVGYRINNTWLDLPPDLSVQMEIYNPLFQTDYIPGSLTYPFNLPADSKLNQRELNFPGELAVSRYSTRFFTAQMFLMDQLWRVGKLNVLRKTKDYNVNFQTDIGDIESRLKEDSLRSLDLGTANLSMQVAEIYPTQTYALFPVKNPNFFDGKKETFGKYLNYYDGGFFESSGIHTITPFPYLVHVLRQVLANYGYQVQGAWLEEEATRRLVIYNNQVPTDAPFPINQHVPDMKVNEFLRAIRSLLGLGFIFNTTAKSMTIVRLKDVLRNTAYVDWTTRTKPSFEWEPNLTNGFNLKQEPDGNDDIYKTLPATWGTYRVGAGKEDIPVSAGTLPTVNQADELKSSRQWLVPQASQKGSTPELEIGQNPFSLRLLSYQGMQPDSQGNLYPQGSNAPVVWEGGQGLYQTAHQEWLEFRSTTELIEAKITFTIEDLLRLKPDLKAMIRYEDGTIKALWEKITLGINNKTGIQEAKVSLFKVPY